MYGIDSGNGYVYGEDESAVTATDSCAEELGESLTDSSAISGTGKDNK